MQTCKPFGHGSPRQCALPGNQSSGFLKGKPATERKAKQERLLIENIFDLPGMLHPPAFARGHSCKGCLLGSSQTWSSQLQAPPCARAGQHVSPLHGHHPLPMREEVMQLGGACILVPLLPLVCRMTSGNSPCLHAPWSSSQG